MGTPNLTLNVLVKVKLACAEYPKCHKIAEFNLICRGSVSPPPLPFSPVPTEVPPSRLHCVPPTPSRIPTSASGAGHLRGYVDYSFTQLANRGVCVEGEIYSPL